MSYANRIWGYLTGTGVIEPLDDIRAGNPPSNPELLQHLTNEFVQSGFNVRHLMRIICQSRTYQLSLDTNKWNEDDTINYSHAKARRLPAEVLFDSVSCRRPAARAEHPRRARRHTRGAAGRCADQTARRLPGQLRPPCARERVRVRAQQRSEPRSRHGAHVRPDRR